MPEFTYTARSLTGENLIGSITAASRREALSALTDRSMFPINVADAKPAKAVWKPAKRIKAEVLAANLSQLADLLSNGVSLLAALEILVEQAAHPYLKEVMTDVRDQVVEGTSLDQALSRHPKVFGELA